MLLKINVCLQFPFSTVPEQPRNFHGQATSPSSIQLSWDPPGDYTGDIIIQSYELYYKDMSTQMRQLRVGVNPSRHSYLLDNLSPYTVYNINMSARSSRGEGASTSLVHIKTLESGTFLLSHNNCLSFICILYYRTLDIVSQMKQKVDAYLVNIHSFHFIGPTKYKHIISVA